MKLFVICIGCVSIFVCSSLIKDEYFGRTYTENFTNFSKRNGGGAILYKIEQNLESVKKSLSSVKNGFLSFSNEIGSVVGTFQDMTNEDRERFINSARPVLYDTLPKMNSSQKQKLRFAILKEFSIKPTKQQQKDATSDDELTDNGLIQKNVKILRFVMLHKNYSNNTIPIESNTFGKKAVNYTSVVNKEIINFFSVPQKETNQLKKDFHTLNNLSEQVVHDTIIQFVNDFVKKKGKDQVDIQENPINKEWLRMFPEDRVYTDDALLSSIRMHLGVFVSILQDVIEYDFEK